MLVKWLFFNCLIRYQNQSHYQNQSLNLNILVRERCFLNRNLRLHEHHHLRSCHCRSFYTCIR